MRKISKESADSIIFGNVFKKSNTEVIEVVGGTRMFLHGNPIAEKIDGKIRITNSGWFSNVTKERLNSIPNVSISQVKDQWFLNGNLWDGSWIEI